MLVAPQVAAAASAPDGSASGGSASARRALLVAPHLSYRTAAYLNAATTLGVRLTVASTSEIAVSGPGWDGIAFDPASPNEAIDQIAEAVSRTGCDGVLASDDAVVEIASGVAAKLGLQHNPANAARLSRRKDLARAAQAEAGLPTPNFARVELSDPDIGWNEWPAVVKPLAWSGSRGVMRVDDRDTYLSAVKHLDALLRADPPRDPYERRHVLIESFLPGEEVAVEALLRDGELIPLAIFDKPDPLDGPTFEETYYVTPSRHDSARQRAVFETVAAVARAYGLVHGPVHAEARLAGDTVWPLEVAARTIGGDCARLLRFGAGHGLEELVLANAVGITLDTRLGGKAAGVLMIPIRDAGVLRRVEGVLAAQSVAGVEDVVIAMNAGQTLVPLPDGASYLGFVFARGLTASAVEASLRAADAELKVIVAPSLPVEVAVG